MTPNAHDARNDQRGDAAERTALLAQLRERLEDQRQSLLRRAAEYLDDIEDLQTSTATHGQGETEHLNRDVEAGLTAALEANTREALDDISSALARMDDGSFGLCGACGAPIDIERLMAVPQARYCLACQQRLERGERPHG